MLDERYHIDNLNAIDTPALAVYPELVSRNIRRAVAMVEPTEGTMLRPHVKTHKTKEVVQMMQQAGINRFKCSTIAEAEMLGLANAPDVLLAYQPTAVKAERLAHLREVFPDTRFSCLVDNLASATMLAERFAAAPYRSLSIWTSACTAPGWLHRPPRRCTESVNSYQVCYP